MPHRTRSLPDRINWALLRMFLTVAEEKSLSRAAERLNLTPSAVSHALKRLEEQAGARLVERNHQRFSPTGLGVMLHEAAKDVYKRINALDGSFRDGAHAISGTLNLLLLSTLVSETFDAFLEDFRKRFPLLKIQIETLQSSEILAKIARNTPAVGLALCPREQEGIRRLPLIRQRYSLYCGRNHPLFSQKTVRKKDLVHENFVSFFSDQMGDSLAALAEYRERNGFTGMVVASANNQDEVKRLLCAGYGIGCLADDSARKDVLEGRLRQLPPEKGIADVPVYLVWSRHRPLGQGEKICIEGLCAAFGRQAPWGGDDLS
ncbi:MAG: LysR family transcriptional regulator [Deltaproteobacteria bacterium]|nr:LysR family transcriptional regulator [Deltaproteobacteria bacterium]